MSTSVYPRCLSRRVFPVLLVLLGLSGGVGLAPIPAMAGVAATDDLRALAARDGWVAVRVELAVSGAAADEAVEDLLFALPDGSYADVERLAAGTALAMRVDAAGLDGLLASKEVARITLAGSDAALWPVDASTRDGAYAPDRILVKFRSELNAAQVDGVLASAYDVPAWLEPEQRFFSTWVVAVAGAAAPIPEVVAAVRGLPNVAYAEPDYRVSIAARPNDPRFRRLWGLENTGQTGGTPEADIRAVAAWDLTTGDPDTVVAVIDTGVDSTHPDLAANMWVNVAERDGRAGVDDDGNGYIDDIHGIDAITGSGRPLDDVGHGTHCAGTIGAVGNNGIGVTGVSWRTKIMALKFLDPSGGWTSDAIEALSYATMMKTRYGVNVRVTSNSWGGGGYSRSLKDAIQASNDAGILFIAAAGNDSYDNDTGPHYPSSYDNAGLIAVASSDHSDGLSWFSNYGLTSVDLAAPGDSILSTLPDNRYGTYSGTSMATPHVAGAAALLWAHQPGLSTAAVKARLLQTVDAKPAFACRMVSGGRLNVYGALIGGSSTPSIPMAPSNLTAMAATARKVNLSWCDTSTNETGFRIERKIGTGAWAQVAEVGANVTTYANIGLTPSTRYDYRIRAFNTLGVSTYSNTATAYTCAAATAIGMGTFVNGTLATTDCYSETRPGGHYRDIYTFAATAGTTYSIEVRSSDFDTYLSLRNSAGVIAENDDVDGTLNSGIVHTPTTSETLTIDVTSYSPGATGAYTLSLVADSTPARPAAPSALGAVVASSTRIDLAWRDNSTDETGFRIERRIGTGTWSRIATTGPNVTAFASTGLTAATNYRYRVRAYNDTGASAYSNTVATRTAAPAAPASLTATAVSTSRINLSWSDTSTNESGFRIERRRGTGAWAQIATVGPDVATFASTGLRASTTYGYRVRAYNGIGTSAYSNTASATTR